MGKLAPDVISRSDAAAILEPHVFDLQGCWRAGWAAWQAYRESEPQQALWTSSRTRAGIIYDGAAAEAERRFKDKPGVNLKRDHGFLIVILESRIALRFKKLDSDLQTRGIPTRQQQAFLWQGDIAGVTPTATKVVVGYQLNSLGTSMTRLLLTCRVGPRLRWTIDIAEEAAGVPVPTLLPSLSPPETGERRPPTVRTAHPAERPASEA